MLERLKEEVLEANLELVRRGLVLFAEEWPFSSAHPSRRHLLNWDDNKGI